MVVYLFVYFSQIYSSASWIYTSLLSHSLILSLIFSYFICWDENLIVIVHVYFYITRKASRWFDLLDGTKYLHQ